MNHAAKLDSNADWPVSTPRWELFHRNETIWRAVLEQCDRARCSIDLEQYILKPEGIGKRLLDLLAFKARQGVQVRVHADGLGSYGLRDSEPAAALIRSGGRISMYNSFCELTRHPLSKAHRLHRKTLLCDRERVMVGGTCYAERMADWCDCMILLEGPLPSCLEAEFERVWQGKPAQGTVRPPPKPSAHWSYTLSGPGSLPCYDLGEYLSRMIAKAERSISLTTPYLLPDKRLLRAMTAAAKRGVTIGIFIPERSDHRHLDIARRPYVKALRRHGVEVRGYTDGMLHAKIALVDDACCSISSYNLDLFSAKLNLENGIISRSPHLCAAVGAQLCKYRAASRRM